MAPTKHRQPLAAADSNIGITSTGLAATTEGKQSAKRKAANMEEPETLPEIDSDDDRLRMVDQNCDQIRRKIRAFITSGEMKSANSRKL
ncbi:hypothetical protein B7494_g7342 [Chlorociboria aeruginascens]|nr:hypothetical protein B7494_g7342 [Chlorociboria aeruginascens]